MNPDNSHLSPAVLAKLVDRVCDAFEQDWDPGAPPSIDEYVRSAVEPLRNELVEELVLSDIELRRQHAMPLPIETYLRDRPALAPRLEQEGWLPSEQPIERQVGSPAGDETVQFDYSGTPRPEDFSESLAGGSQPDRLVGRRIGRYHVLKRVARGGMGVVYQARDIQLDRIVALKTIVGGHLASEEAVHRFRIEAQAAAQLDHSGIIPIFEVDVQNDVHYYVMSFVEGENLGELLKKGPLDLRRGAEIVMRVARAVAHAHRAGIVHRDLKPANILLDERREPRITDFGLAKRAGSNSDLTREGQVLGTPGYMAPEQAAGHAHHAEESTDIYSLGAILYACLTGRPPFESDDYLETLELIRAQPPQPPRTARREIHHDLETICLKCLAKSPRSRYATASELADDLERFLDGEPILAKPLSVWSRLSAWARRKPALAATLAAFIPLYIYHLFRIFVARTEMVGSWENMMVTTVVGVWIATAWIYQNQLLKSGRELPILFAWTGTEITLTTVFLLSFSGPRSPYALGFVVLTAVAALRQRVRLVAFVMTGSIVWYLAVLADAWFRRPENLPDDAASSVMLIVGLLVVGLTQILVLRRRRKSSPTGSTGSPSPSRPIARRV